MRATDSPVEDGWLGARIGAEHRDRAHREATRIDAEVDIGEPGRPLVVLAFLVVALATTLIEFISFGTSPTPSELSRAGGAGIGVVATGAWWKLIVSNLLHGGLLHLAFNTFVIYLTGRWLEHLVGRWMVVATVGWSAVLASIGSLLVDVPTVAIGASGVAFGLVGCAVAVDPRARTATGVIARQLVVVNVIFTFILPGISVGGHFGGLLAGLLVGWACWQRGDAVNDESAGIVTARTGIGKPRARAAVAVAIVALLPLSVMAVGPRMLPGEAADARANATAWLLQRQLSGSELTSGRSIDAAECEPADQLLRYRCVVDGDVALVEFDPRDDQWAMSIERSDP